MNSNKRPLRILHVVGAMNRGGIETWLMHVLRNINRDAYQMDFLVHTTEPGAYNNEICALGSKLIPCTTSSKPWLYAKDLQRILQKYGPYDVVHSHVHHFSGLVTFLAKKAGVPIRIAHSHLDSSPLEAKRSIVRHLYLALSKVLISLYATTGLACSNVAAIDLFGLRWNKDSRWQLLYYGIDMNKFKEKPDSKSLRLELGIPIDAFVIGHVGRFQKQKNHRFILEIFAEVVKQESQAFLLLVGEGIMKAEIEEQASQMGLKNQIIFAGSRSDIPKIMMGVMDVFILPSLNEGLPMVGIEAQAAGLPIVLSDVVTEEVIKDKLFVRRISLSESASVWADQILTLKNSKSIISQENSISILEKSEFNISHSIKELIKIYDEQYCQSHKSESKHSTTCPNSSN